MAAGFHDVGRLMAKATFASHAGHCILRGSKMEKRIAMKGKVLLAVVIGAALGLSACATVKGVGRDIESVGQAGSDAIHR